MKKIFNSFDNLARLIRLPNLLVLALTQYFVRYGIFYPILASRGVGLQMTELDFALLVFSTLLIAAGGYIINDYYDVTIDEVNRPEKMTIGKFISMKQASFWHYALTILGCIIGIYVAYKVGSLKLGGVHIVSAIVLFYYSLKYKRQPFVGNLAVAILAALSVIIVYLFEFFALKQNAVVFGEMIGYFRTLNILVFGYAFFAFLISLIREIAKDIEDYDGDKAFESRTLPIVMGIKKTHQLLIGLSLGCGVFIAFAGFAMFWWSYDAAGWYFCIVLGGLWIYFLLQLFRLKTKKDYHFASTLLKIIMIAGILSMQLLYADF